MENCKEMSECFWENRSYRAERRLSSPLFLRIASVKETQITEIEQTKQNVFKFDKHWHHLLVVLVIWFQYLCTVLNLFAANYLLELCYFCNKLYILHGSLNICLIPVLTYRTGQYFTTTDLMCGIMRFYVMDLEIRIFSTILKSFRR